MLCPSYPALFSLNELLADSPIQLGAQNCSPHEEGAYTGQVSARSLKEAGCSYCIVGHSEVRRYLHASDMDVAHAAYNLCSQNIEPIICIGETQEAREAQRTMHIIEAQLEPVLGILKNTTKPIIIAYEPVWAIGTGTVPELSYLQDIFNKIHALISKTHKGAWRLIYGGSVSESTIAALSRISHLSGFLIGGASLDFQNFEKIVSLGK